MLPKAIKKEYSRAMMKFDWVSPTKYSGRIILTAFPGLNLEKNFSVIQLRATLSYLKIMKCTTIISLVEENEFAKFCGKKIFKTEISNTGLTWHHLPIKDYNVPNKTFFRKWDILSPTLHLSLSKGDTICIHCMGGIGRSGTIASVILIEAGEDNENAIRMVRKKRDGAIENLLQENFVRNYKYRL